MATAWVFLPSSSMGMFFCESVDWRKCNPKSSTDYNQICNKESWASKKRLPHWKEKHKTTRLDWIRFDLILMCCAIHKTDAGRQVWKHCDERSDVQSRKGYIWTEEVTILLKSWHVLWWIQCGYNRWRTWPLASCWHVWANPDKSSPIPNRFWYWASFATTGIMRRALSFSWSHLCHSCGLQSSFEVSVKKPKCCTWVSQHSVVGLVLFFFRHCIRIYFGRPVYIAVIVW